MKECSTAEADEKQPKRSIIYLAVWRVGIHRTWDVGSLAYSLYIFFLPSSRPAARLLSLCDSANQTVGN